MNKYLEKIAEQLSDSDIKALDSGYDRYTMQGALGGIGSTLVGLAAAGPRMAKDSRSLMAGSIPENVLHGVEKIHGKYSRLLGGVATAGAALGVGKAYMHNKHLDDVRGKDPHTWATHIAGDKKGYIAPVFFASSPIGGTIPALAAKGIGIYETSKNNRRVQKAKEMLQNG